MTVDVARAASEQYGRILDDFAVITCDYPSEHDMGCAAFATRALLARRPDDAFRNDRIDRWLTLLDVREPHSAFRPRQGLLGHETRRFSSASSLLIHEGYLHEPLDECAAEIEELRKELGERFWAVSPALWSAWGSKALFRPRCRRILGEESVPPGVEAVVTDVGEVVTLLKLFQAETSGPAIVKLPGSGGFANAILEPGHPDAEEVIRSLWTDHVHHTRPVDVVIEAWLPWDSTHSLSFLVSPDQPPGVLATCDQVVDADGVFVGSRSDMSLSADDTDSVLAHVRRLVEAMDSDGYVGVAAIDVIIGSADAWDGIGLALPSGSRMIVIECNPRFNYHNKIGLIVERFARVWGIPSHDLRWTSVNIEAGAHRTVEALLASRPRDAEIGVPPPPDRDRPSRRLFAHRTEKAVELTISLRQN
ncbi:MAG: hypothetical protein ACRDOT_02635 [Aeromicrobium sp.]